MAGVILLASSNQAKQQKLAWLLQGLPLRPLTPVQVGLSELDVSEGEGQTHQQIAESKALAWARASSALAIASDGGLDIPALGARWQGVYTNRLTGPGGGGQERASRLLHLMESYHGQQRRATWHEALAIAVPDGVLASWCVTGATGYIVNALPPKEESSGLWVFGLWRFPSFGKLYYQLSEEELVLANDHWVQLRSLVQRYFQDQRNVLCNQ